ncbi:hypothetical protein RDV89_14885 [Nocardioides zeae]|uniref:Uncharacterized protein n=1 Tax=Nocardioides imazamoxiresistens TaxID=3231893 RepID=A0ABU3PYP8_9ACTN|nr:hypothetical protein [Nocardioides zeae]MDT9594368.1 hypothetical protein [Nocardioides zeae]
MVREVGRLPGHVGSGAVDGQGVVHVVFDDGTLQDRVDAEHGPGHVAVVSALRPVGPTM